MRFGSGGGQYFIFVLFVVGHGQAHTLPNASLGTASTKIAAAEVRQVRRMDTPVVALAIRRATGFDEAIVEREVVPNRVAPAGTTSTKVSVVIQYPLVDVGQDELLLRRTENGHGDQTDVRVRWFGFLAQQAT